MAGSWNPGRALAVDVDGKILYSESFGFADLEERVPVWPTTKFRVGSISKPLTAMALMQLAEAGKLDLDARVQKYVPSFPDKGSSISVRMVAGHLAGIRHHKDDEMEIQRHYDNILEALKIFENDPLVAPAGNKFSYSSSTERGDRTRIRRTAEIKRGTPNVPRLLFDKNRRA
jgi:serine beta-lactamase-like protein LACTB